MARKVLEVIDTTINKRKRKELFLIRGVSGSGKTTFVESVKRQFDITASADDFMINENGDYVFDASRLGECHQKCIDVVKNGMVNMKSRIFVHNTLTTDWEMEPYFKLAAKFGYLVHSIIKEKRHDGKNVHCVDEVVLEKQRKRFKIKL